MKQIIITAVSTLAAIIIYTVPATAKVATPKFEELIKRADYIIVAKVIDIGETIDHGHPKLKGAIAKIATVKIIEAWKGNISGEARYLASPTWTCDESSAVENENAILFLEGKQDSVMSIIWSGWGRFPMEWTHGDTYVAAGYSRMPKSITDKIESIFIFGDEHRVIGLSAFRDFVISAIKTGKE